MRVAYHQRQFDFFFMGTRFHWRVPIHAVCSRLDWMEMSQDVGNSQSKDKDMLVDPAGSSCYLRNGRLIMVDVEFRINESLLAFFNKIFTKLLRVFTSEYHSYANQLAAVWLFYVVSQKQLVLGIGYFSFRRIRLMSFVSLMFDFRFSGHNCRTILPSTSSRLMRFVFLFFCFKEGKIIFSLKKW